MDGEKRLRVVALTACAWFVVEVCGAAIVAGGVTWWFMDDDWALAAAVLCAVVACRPWAWTEPNDGECSPLPS